MMYAQVGASANGQGSRTPLSKGIPLRFPSLLILVPHSMEQRTPPNAIYRNLSGVGSRRFTGKRSHRCATLSLSLSHFSLRPTHSVLVMLPHLFFDCRTLQRDLIYAFDTAPNAQHFSVYLAIRAITSHNYD
jgi:hypothetical protein